jgi:putative tryptophan/tyrosine transport system permease protein
LNTILSVLSVSVYEGLAYGMLTIGFFLTFRVLDFPDLTMEGSFPMGGAAAAALIVYAEWNPFLATFGAVMVGVLAGLVTGFINTKLKVTALLSGILMMVGLYSVNLRIMSGSNIPLLRHDTVFDLAGKWLGLGKMGLAITVAGAFALVAFLLLTWFLHTEIGLALRASGDNEQMVRGVGSDTDKNILIGCALANGMIALTGSLVAQYQGFTDVSMGIGIIVTALASAIIGTALFRPNRVFTMLLACFAGSFFYRMIITIALRMGMNPGDLRLITSLMVLLALTIPLIQKMARGEWVPPAPRL